MANAETMKVLQMLEESKITADEAARLLDAVGESPAGPEPRKLETKGRFLNVRVYKQGTDKPHVKVTVPLSLAKWALRFAPEHATAHVGGKEINMGELEQWLESAPGDIITVQDEEDNERVEISVV